MAGSFTYAGTAAGSAITSVRDKVRLEMGDTDPSSVLFYDEEIDVYLGNRADNVLLTAADLCDAAATKFARAFTFQTDGQQFKRETLVSAFQARAKELRKRAQGVSTLTVTKVDGYSQTVASDAVSASGTANASPRQNYYVVDGVDALP